MGMEILMTDRDFLVPNYADEDPEKILNSYSLIEVIHELIDPTGPHDFDYLRLRIDLLREVFNLGHDSTNENARVIDSLLTGNGKFKPMTLLPFEGAWEVPDSIDTDAHIAIEKQFSADLKEMRAKAYAIQRAYITYIILHAIEGNLRSKTVTLYDLISAGLPESEPETDFDNW